ncbi:MAG: hypothetical protein P4L44_00545 [Oryzomonas sp.]|uniref:hypothetical protein n=1 Tax=Oryzomonas sp. TaxID=2855186 RepID=UPI0028403129|nr:hypothetical protein [Oryzomonas sp.]MDR3578433.1 hypothetical protein [Oryzomonas sp.]
MDVSEKVTLDFTNQEDDYFGVQLSRLVAGELIGSGILNGEWNKPGAGLADPARLTLHVIPGNFLLGFSS